MSIAATTTTLGGDDYRWIATEDDTKYVKSGTLDYSAFTEGTHFPNGYFPSGLSLTYSTTTGLYGPFAGGAPGTANEVQTATIGGSGLTSFTLTYSGQTTGSLDDAATPAEVETALKALSNIGANDVEVTGTAGSVYRIQFVGDLAGTNVAALTSTPTGGTGSVTIATVTAGVRGLDGFLFHNVPTNGTNDVTAAILPRVAVIAAYLPVPDGLSDGYYPTDTVASEA